MNHGGCTDPDRSYTIVRNDEFGVPTVHLARAEKLRNKRPITLPTVVLQLFSLEFSRSSPYEILQCGGPFDVISIRIYFSSDLSL